MLPIEWIATLEVQLQPDLTHTLSSPSSACAQETGAPLCVPRHPRGVLIASLVALTYFLTLATVRFNSVLFIQFRPIVLLGSTIH